MLHFGLVSGLPTLRHLLIANILPFLSHRTPHLSESLRSLLPLHPAAPLALFLFERGKFIRRKEREGVRGERKREGGREKFYWRSQSDWR
jgi:hypothetical protein